MPTNVNVHIVGHSANVNGRHWMALSRFASDYIGGQSGGGGGGSDRLVSSGHY